MSFLSNLGKGFIRSAVNQVGRDGGRVISNSVYGDAHATPIRRVGNSFTNNNHATESTGDLTEVTADEVRQSYIESGYTLKITRTSLGQVIGVALLGVIPLFISSLAFFAAAIRRVWYFFTDDAVYAKKALVAKRVPDRRYSRGYRVDGYVKGWDEVRIPPTNSERFAHLKVAVIYTAVAAALFYWSFWCIQQGIEQTPTATEQVE